MSYWRSLPTTAKENETHLRKDGDTMAKTTPGRVNLQELFDVVEESGLNDYPNQERIRALRGEPEAFPRDPGALSIVGLAFEQLTHRSPCFRFIEARRLGK